MWGALGRIGRTRGLHDGRCPRWVRGHGVKTTWMERVTATDSAYGEPAPAQRAVFRDCLQAVGTTGWQEPAVRSEQRADKASVTLDDNNEHVRWPPHRRAHCRPTSGVRRSRADAARATLAKPADSAESRSTASSALVAEPAPALARTTTRSPDGRPSSRSPSRWRRRRDVRCRTTAPPTALPTTKPAVENCCSLSGLRRWTASNGRPARTPRRTIAVNSTELRTRRSGGSTGASGRAVKQADGRSYVTPIDRCDRA